MVGGDGRAHPLLDRGQVLGDERARQVEVVVEAVLDRRADAQLRAGEQVEHRLGHDVRGRVAHRVEVVVGVGVEQLLGRALVGRRELEVVVVWRALALVVHVVVPGRSGVIAPAAEVVRPRGRSDDTRPAAAATADMTKAPGRCPGASSRVLDSAAAYRERLRVSLESSNTTLALPSFEPTKMNS